jgi:hemerythrin-like domain-containing protein
MATSIPLSQVTLPGHRAPGAGFEAPFEMLDACHERVQRMLRLLGRLQQHLADKGWDSDAAQAAVDVMRYFDQAAPLHHEDEERHVFPPLLASGDPALVELVRRLQQDHIDMAEGWARARAVLAGLTQPPPPHWPGLSPQQAAALSGFAGLYRQHLLDEDGVVYPAAQAALPDAALRAMSADMMRRRGLDPA